MASSHDALVKRVFSVRENAIGELQSVLPPGLLSTLALDALDLVDGSFVDPELVHRHTDRLYSVPLASGQGNAFVYVLFEHQSSDDPRMTFRVLRYLVRIWEHFLRDNPNARLLPVVIPLVLFHDEGRWQSPTSFHDLFPKTLVQIPACAALIPGFRFLLDDISAASDRDLQARQMSAFARLALWLLRDARFDRLDDTIAVWLDLFSQLLRSPGGQEATQTLFCYIFDVRGSETAQQLAARIPDPSLREAAMTIAEQLRQEGLEQGLEQGSLLRLRAVVAKQLTLKFGELDSVAQARVANADEAALDNFTERVLSANSIEDVFN